MRSGFPAGCAALLTLVLICIAPGRLSGVLAGETPPTVTKPDSVEERRLLYSLTEERTRLQDEYRRRGEELDLREIELKTLDAEVDKKIAEMQELRQEVQKLLAAKNTAEAKRIKGLSRMYEKMSPVQASRLLAGLDQELAVKILAGMAPKSGAKVLDNLPTKTATRLSLAYSSLKKR